jgi:hypothetical protein
MAMVSLVLPIMSVDCWREDTYLYGEKSRKIT